MSVIAASATRSRFKRLSIAGAIAIGIAAAVSVATVSNPWLGRAVTEGVNEGLHRVQTVASMLAERSPGARPEGALANTKHKRQAAIHERALPKIRGPFAPPTAYEALASPPSTPIAPPPQAPLFSSLAGGPPTTIPPGGSTPGGPPILMEIPSPGGGGGGFTPPIITTTELPPPVTPSVPEPATWAMMLLGFTLMGRVLKRQRAAGLKPARE